MRLSVHEAAGPEDSSFRVPNRVAEPRDGGERFNRRIAGRPRILASMTMKGRLAPTGPYRTSLRSIWTASKQDITS